MCIFDEKTSNEYFGGLGHHGGQVWNQAGKKGRFRAIYSTVLEVMLALLSVFVAGVFVSAFSETLLFSTLGDFGAQR